MSLLLFELTGEMALWRNVYESMGSFSCLGPAPSALAGLCGAALGFPSPRSQAAEKPDEKLLQTQWKKGLPWPVSPELLQWEQSNDFHVACRWTGGIPRRVPWNVNGCKEVKVGTNLRMQQQVIEKPSYEVGIRIPEDAARKLADALRTPAFPLFLGCSFCPAILRNIRQADALTESNGWAFHTDRTSLGESTPFSRHVVSVSTGASFERLKIDGYWVYPTPEMPGVLQTDPLIAGYLP